MESLKQLHSKSDTFLHSHKKYLIAETANEAHKIDEYVANNSVYQIRNWFNWWDNVLRKGAKEAITLSITNVRSLRDYFPVQYRVIRHPVTDEQEVVNQSGRNQDAPLQDDGLRNQDIRSVFDALRSS